jgi:nucleoside-diphosphate-sugar epimerase
MKILVTGAAGFIGSHLCERLLQDKKHSVIGIDGWISNETIKQHNLSALLKAKNPNFQFVRANLLDADLHRLLNHVDVVYHLAGMPGVRSSWGNDFQQYTSNNILATQRLLEACKGHSLKKFIYVSTSSVYGEKDGKVSEDASTDPLSPYGVSKLSCEYLCKVYQKNEGIPVVILRYFTVYGPRQRPDMAFHRFIDHILQGKPIPVYGDGSQMRDFTYISDCVEGTFSVLENEDVIGETVNIGGMERASVLEVIDILQDLFHQKIAIDCIGDPKGEPKQTWANIEKAERLLHYQPMMPLRLGLQKEVSYLKAFYEEREE